MRLKKRSGIAQLQSPEQQQQHYELKPSNFPDTQFNKRVLTKKNTEFVLPEHTCTDVICTVAFTCLLCALVALSVIAFLHGDPRHRLLPHDSHGNTCGHSPGFEGRRALMHFDLTVTSEATTRQVCVASCPAAVANYSIDLVDAFCDTLDSARVKCPPYFLGSTSLFDYCVPLEFMSSTTPTTTSDDEPLTSAYGLTNDPNATLVSESGQNLTRRALLASTAYLSSVMRLEHIGESMLRDLVNSYRLVLMCLLLAALLSFVWIVLLSLLVKFFVFFALFVLLAALAFFTCLGMLQFLFFNDDESYLQLQFAPLYGNDGRDYATWFKCVWIACSLVSANAFVVIFLLVVFLRRSIFTATTMLSEASRTVLALPTLLFWPAVPACLLVAACVYSALVCLYLDSFGTKIYKVVETTPGAAINASSRYYKPGDLCTPEQFASDKRADAASLASLECLFASFGHSSLASSSNDSTAYDKMMDLLATYRLVPQLFVLAMLAWSIAIISSLNQMTIAGTFSRWYWTPFEPQATTNDHTFSTSYRKRYLQKQQRKKLPFFLLVRSYACALFYHLGTLVLGSLLIAPMTLVRVSLELVASSVRANEDASKTAKCLSSLCRCCFWCLNRAIKYLNRYAYVLTVVYSQHFLKATSRALTLIRMNALNALVVDKVAAFVLLLSNAAITSLSVMFAFFLFTHRVPLDTLDDMLPLSLRMDVPTNLNYVWLPIGVVACGSFLIAKLFLDVYDMGVDTLVMCALIDLDENDGSKQRPYFMSKRLQGAFRH